MAWWGHVDRTGKDGAWWGHVDTTCRGKMICVDNFAEVGGISLLVVPAMRGKNDLGPAILRFCWCLDDVDFGAMKGLAANVWMFSRRCR